MLLFRKDMNCKHCNGRITRRAVLLMVVILAVVVLAWHMVGDYLLIRGFVFLGVRDANQKRIRLLCGTDHKALLEACRELSRRASDGDVKVGKYNIAKGGVAEAASFPRAILNLKPNYIYIDENDCGRVMVEMFGGLDHFGVLAYSEDYKKPSRSEYGDREILAGLWYYDDGYDRNPKYDKTIDALIAKYKQDEEQ